MATFSNSATLSYNGRSVSSNTTFGTLNETVSAVKTAVPGTYSPGSALTYVVSARNTGDTDVNGITITDDLGAYTTDVGTGTVTPLALVPGSVRLYVNGTLQPNAAVTEGPPLAVSGVNIPAGGDAVLVYQATANEFAPLGGAGEIDNTATLSGGDLAAPVTAAAAAQAAADPVLTVNKTLNPTVVESGDTVTYTFVIQNSGAQETNAADTVVLSDTFDPALSNLTVTYNGAPMTEGTDYTYDETTGQFATLPGAMTVPGAAYAQSETTGAWSASPGSSTLTVSGTV